MIRLRDCQKFLYHAVSQGMCRYLFQLFCLSQIVPRFSGFKLLFFILFTAFFAWQLVTYALSILRLADMYNFYTHLLRIPDVSRLTRYSNQAHLNPGRHTNNCMAGSCETYRCHSRRQPTHSHIIYRGGVRNGQT